MSEYRSFGSNYHPSSQSRKMSIGVMVVDSQPNRNHPPPDKVAARAEKLKAADLQPSKKVKGDLAANQRSSAKGTQHATSPWRSPRSSSRKLGTLENVLCRQTSSLSGSKGLNKGLNGAHQAPVRDSFHDIPVSSPRRSDDELISGRNGKEMEKSPERMGEPPSAVLQQKV
ncbi:hypothetical protein HA466_0072880 [Hirschfeldia incana]|nr:hypothetical protein HA466_0072880 [Hirschfeldia incana]